MKYFSKLKNVSVLEIFVIAIFIVYLVFPIATPIIVAPYIESALGMIVLFCVVVFLFIYSNPILAVLFVFVAYELLRRSTKAIFSTPKVNNYTRLSQPAEKIEKEVSITEVNTNTTMGNGVVDQTTLEEIVVAQMAPIGKSEPSNFITSTFKPVATTVQGASPI
jgi:hypothetical protein